MSRLEKTFVFSCLILIVLLCGAQVFNHPTRQDVQDPSPAYDLVGQTYYSCCLDGAKITSEKWQYYLDERHLTNGPLLVVWLSALGCSPCNKYVLDKTAEIEEKGLPVLIVGADFRLQSSTEKIVYLDRNDSLGLSAEELKIPFVFIYDNEVRHIIFPSPNNNAAFEMYLEVVARRYGNNEMFQ